MQGRRLNKFHFQAEHPEIDGQIFGLHSNAACHSIKSN